MLQVTWLRNLLTHLLPSWANPPPPPPLKGRFKYFAKINFDNDPSECSPKIGKGRESKMGKLFEICPNIQFLELDRKGYEFD